MQSQEERQGYEKVEIAGECWIQEAIVLVSAPSLPRASAMPFDLEAI